MSALAVAKSPTFAVPRRPPLFLVRSDSSFAALSEEPETESDIMTARDVAGMLRMHPKKVYELPIAQVRLSPRRVRWLKSDVRAYISRQRVGR